MSFNNHANKPDDQAAAGSDSKSQFPMSDDFYDVINMTPPLMNTKMNHEYYSSNGNLNSLDHIDTMDTGHNLSNQVQGTSFDGYDNVRINSASSSNSSNFPNQFEIAMDSSFIPQQHQHQDQLQQQQHQLHQHQHQQQQQQQQASQYIHPGYGQSNKGSITSPDLLSPVSNLKSQTSNTTLSPHASNGYNLSIPRSPGAYSTHSSAFSDGSVNHPDSPYVDAASQFSNANPPSFNDYTDGSQIQNNQDQQFIQNDQFPESSQYLQNQQAFQNHQQLNSNFQGLPNQFLDPDPSNLLNTFDSEIALGGSISSTNLVSMDEPNSYNIGQRSEIPQFNYSINNQPMTDFHMGTQLVVTPPTESTAPNKLTENNLLNYTNSIQQHPSQDASFLSKEIIISIQSAPEEIAAKTPSLFSNSSANSSIHNSPAQGTGQANELSRQNTGNALSVDHYKSQKQQEYSGNSLIPNSQLVNTQQTTTLLKPDEFQSMRRGRRKSHSASSRNSSKSPNRLGRSNEEDDFYGDEDEDEDDDEDFEDEYEAEGDDGYLAPRQKLSSRQKMLELASPTQSTKKTQKHPSVYACHLCEKRFTRPYNLKSHLRTHTDERPFICNVCGKAFARQHDRKRHEELHTGEKKFQCKGFLRDGTEYGCSRKFARADALRRHFQTDNGKACIMLLIEEEKREKIQSDGNPNNLTNSKNANDFLMSNNMSHHHQKGKIPKVAISPPD